MRSVKEIVKELKVFERNKIPLEIKVLGVATYIQTSSVRRTAKILGTASCLEVISTSLGKEVRRKTADFSGEKAEKSDSNR